MSQLTPEQFKRRLDGFANGLGKVITESVELAGVQLNADIKGRIFSASGTKDTKGNTRRYKSKSWKKKRSKKGLQTAKVDYIFEGDLQRSVKLFDSTNNAEIKIVGKKNVDKARGNEDLYPSKKVFTASDEEAERAVEVFEESISEYILKVFK